MWVFSCIFVANHNDMAQNIEENLPETMKLDEFAIHLGVSSEAVRKAVRFGRIIKGYRKEGYRMIILPKIAIEEWRANFNHIEGQNTELGIKLGVLDKNYLAKPKKSDDPAERSLQDIKKEQIRLKNQLTAVQLAKETGKLVDAQKVYAALRNVASVLRNDLTSLPDRVIADIRSAQTDHDAWLILTTEIERILTDMANLTDEKMLKFHD